MMVRYSTQVSTCDNDEAQCSWLCEGQVLHEILELLIRLQFEALRLCLVPIVRLLDLANAEDIYAFDFVLYVELLRV